MLKSPLWKFYIFFSSLLSLFLSLSVFLYTVKFPCFLIIVALLDYIFNVGLLLNLRMKSQRKKRKEKLQLYFYSSKKFRLMLWNILQSWIKRSVGLFMYYVTASWIRCLRSFVIAILDSEYHGWKDKINGLSFNQTLAFHGEFSSDDVRYLLKVVYNLSQSLTISKLKENFKTVSSLAISNERSVISEEYFSSIKRIINMKRILLNLNLGPCHILQGLMLNIHFACSKMANFSWNSDCVEKNLFVPSFTRIILLLTDYKTHKKLMIK